MQVRRAKGDGRWYYYGNGNDALQRHCQTNVSVLTILITFAVKSVHNNKQSNIKHDSPTLRVRTAYLTKILSEISANKPFITIFFLNFEIMTLAITFLFFYCRKTTLVRHVATYCRLCW